MFNEGMIPECLFDACGIPEDTKLVGLIVKKDVTISQENRQQARVSTIKDIAMRTMTIQKDMNQNSCLVEELTRRFAEMKGCRRQFEGV